MRIMKFLVIFVLVALSGCVNRPSSSKKIDSFNTSVAIAAAHRISSPGKGRFYAYFVHPGGGGKESINLLREALVQSAKDQTDIAVLGSNPALNQSVLKKALASFQKDSLRGVTVLCVGENNNANDLMVVAAQTGAVIRSTKYGNEGRNPVGKDYDPDPYGVIDKNNQRRAYWVMVSGGKALVVGEMK